MVLIHIISSSQKARILRLYSFIPFQQKNVPFISSLHPTNARILRLLCMKIRSKIRTNFDVKFIYLISTKKCSINLISSSQKCTNFTSIFIHLISTKKCSIHLISSSYKCANYTSLLMREYVFISSSVNSMS